MREFELVLQRRVPKNPTPHINAGGDCGACVLSALTGLPVRDVYKAARPDNPSSTDPFSFYEMRSALYALQKDDLIDNLNVDCPIWIEDVARYPFGFSSWMMSIQWFNYIHLGLQAGYYAVCEVNMRGEEKNPVRGLETDHWVLICGARLRWEPCRSVTGAKTGHQEVLVRDSATCMPEERWVEKNDFLRRHGGFQAMLVKPMGA